MSAPSVELGFAPFVSRLDSVSADTIYSVRARYLLEEMIPLGEFSLFAGRANVGKSTVTVAWAAAVTRGELEGELLGQPRAVLYIASEDSREHTIVPRLRAAGADLTMVHFPEVRSGNGSIALPGDEGELEQLVLRHDAALVVLDPATSVIDHRLDGNSDRGMREGLESIARIAQRTGAAIVGIVHFTKAKGTDVASMITGTGAWTQVARSTIAVGRDDESGQCILSLAASNLGTTAIPSQMFEIVPMTITLDDGSTASIGRAQWQGPTDRHASEFFNPAGGPRASTPRVNPVVEWLRALMADHGGTMAYAEVVEAAGGLGYSPDRLRRARETLGLSSEKEKTPNGGWIWSSPASAD